MRQKRKNFKAPKGMHDILPRDQKYWLRVINVFNELALGYGFSYIETPILEERALFDRSLGETSEVVMQKEMYILTTKGGDELVMRPEMTAGIARSYIENGLFDLPQPLKLYSLGPVFRHESPQAGRYRQFHQADLEIIGGSDSILDAQIIQLCYLFLKEIGIKMEDIALQINSIGCSQCRAGYKSNLKQYFKLRLNRFCRECKEKYKNNLLRLVECSQEKCQQILNQAPQQVDYLCRQCFNHFKSVLEYLDELKIPYFVNFKLTRGLDYYTKTVFEFWPEDELGKTKPLSLASGGRYDGLIEQLGGRDTSAVGGAPGLERIINYMKEKDILVPDVAKAQIFLVQLGELGKKKSLQLFQSLKEAGIVVAEAFGRSSIQAQLKAANHLQVPWAVILGQKEAFDDAVIIRDMDSGIQETVPISKAVSEIQKRLNRPKTKIKIKRRGYKMLIN